MLNCLINGYHPDEWALMQNEPVFCGARPVGHGLGLSQSFHQLLGCLHRPLSVAQWPEDN
ncbi:hypothetical protein [Sodalis-like endosymbiont of Proechinophthirus fluctus]|uniref:hypothetical protein n=1 Tax=Sodalis-like endosymbiont of Proechinophthirus fluctus TaxID=1462730 RepID=UPI00164F88AA|nr:hypothetical protein [Sodalis-like endosymbiont of Proechinophthirus fluctus]